MVEERKLSFSTFPVVDEKGVLVGLLSGHVAKPRYAKRKIAEAMTPRAQVQTIHKLHRMVATRGEPTRALSALEIELERRACRR